MNVCMHACMCVCRYVCVYVCVCVCTYACIDVRTYVHAIHFLTYYYSSIYFSIMQTLIGISWVEALTDSFSSAVLKSVSDAVGVSDSAVSGTIGVASGRKLLADINMNYNLSIFTNQSSIQTVNKLQTSFDNGAFLTSLRTFSGINITALASVMVQDSSLNKVPTVAPTPFIRAAASVMKKGKYYYLLRRTHCIEVKLEASL